jgi:hypothetical protein
LQAARSAFGGRFEGEKRARGAILAPKATERARKMVLEGADGQAAVENRRQAVLNDARERGLSPSADRRRGWARGELPRTASKRAPPPEARRAEERGRTPRRTPPIFTRAALPEGHRPAWPPRATPEAEASERTASELHPQPRQRRGRAAPAKAAHRRASGGAVAASGAAIPERRPRAARVQRSGAAAPRVRGEAAQRGAA